MRERNNQIKLMAHLYDREIRVLVWLGASGTPNLVPSAVTTPKELKKAAYDLCEVQYWQRVWIVQETGAATNLNVH